MESAEHTIFSALASTGLICENGIPMADPLSPVIEQLKQWRAKNKPSQAQALIVFKDGSKFVPSSAFYYRTGKEHPPRLSALW